MRFHRFLFFFFFFHRVYANSFFSLLTYIYKHDACAQHSRIRSTRSSIYKQRVEALKCLSYTCSLLCNHIFTYMIFIIIISSLIYIIIIWKLIFTVKLVFLPKLAILLKKLISVYKYDYVHLSF